MEILREIQSTRFLESLRRYIYIFLERFQFICDAFLEPEAEENVTDQNYQEGCSCSPPPSSHCYLASTFEQSRRFEGDYARPCQLYSSSHEQTNTGEQCGLP